MRGYIKLLSITVRNEFSETPPPSQKSDALFAHQKCHSSGIVNPDFLVIGVAMRNVVFGLVLLLAGCAEFNESYRSINRTAAEIMYGDAAIAGTLAPYPQSSGCSDTRCRELDSLEERLYSNARAGTIRWVQLVDVFYARRAELFPSVGDNSSVRELRSYQRALAEQMDLKKITESQWVYLIERKNNELNARGR